ncbi:MAG: ABC transporter ATP-binding protein [Eubacteriales bacterium]|nr:ABC transporter ATP-binding protein [Eubacteriales bacterium]
MIYDVNNLCFSYLPEREVLKNITLTLEEGEILTILGPNGAGKSTLLRCMLNLLTPQNGSVLLCDKSIKSMKPRETAALVSYVQQTQHTTFAYSVLDYVLMGRAPMLGMFEKPKKADHEAAYRALEEMGISHLADKPCTQISGGERQQAMIARAIVQTPKAILFDEPTAHLDSGNQLRTLRIIKKLSQAGYALIVTTHNPDHAILLGGSAAILNRNGRLIKGPTDEIITQENLCDVYDADLRLRYLPEEERIVCITPKL